MECVRVRLVFEDRKMLNKSQKSKGLKRSWFLLKPQLQTISDLSSYLLRRFDLYQSCPHGLLLFMDGFVLPHFESTCILKDKDIIGVKKKGGTLCDVIEEGDRINSVEEVDIMEKQSVHTGLLFLSNEFEKEIGGYQYEAEEDDQNQKGHFLGTLYEENCSGGEEHLEETLHEENCSVGNAVSKKRKVSKNLQSSKKKRQLSVLTDGVGNDIHTKQTENYHNGAVLSRKSVCKKVSNVKTKENMRITPGSAERSDNDVGATPRMKRAEEEENNKGMEDVSQKSGGTKKASRSARRKKAKRQWMRAMAKIGKKATFDSSKGLTHWKQESTKNEMKDVVSHSKGLIRWEQSLEKEAHKNMIEHKQPNQRSVAEDDVPIVVRPGHIRFEPLEKDQAVQQSQVPVPCETIQWNGIGSKKKAHKWGKEKKGQKWGKERVSSWQRNDYRKLEKEFAQVSTVEKEISLNDASSFDKFPVLPGLPKEGDVVAYRQLELSSSFTPELSSFRIGKISYYDPDSRRILLMPLPKDASELRTENWLHRENGSLEVDFSSLMDVRIVKQGDLDPAKVVTGWGNEWPAGNKNAVPNKWSSNNKKDTESRTPASEAVNAWDQFSEALNAKKVQLSQENGWNKEWSTGKRSWSYRSLRVGALGQ